MHYEMVVVRGLGLDERVDMKRWFVLALIESDDVHNIRIIMYII